MCLGIPGKVVTIFREHDLLMGKIDFGGVVKQACLETVPQVIVGDYVLIHVGFCVGEDRRSQGASRSLRFWRE